MSARAGPTPASTQGDEAMMTATPPSALRQWFDERGVSVSLPSLRADAFSVGLAEAVSRVRKSRSNTRWRQSGGIPRP